MDWLSPSIPFVVALQKYAALKPVMQFLSFLGSAEFFLLALPLCYWCINRSLGWRLGLLVIGNAALNDTLKVLFALPRPFWISDQVRQLASSPETGFGLPSGHAQGAAAFWPFLALQNKARVKRALAVGAAAGVVVLISLSRFFLGVHFPADALAGAVIGFAFLALFLSFVDKLALSFKQQPLAVQVVLIIGAVSLGFALFGLALGIGTRPGSQEQFGEHLMEARSWKPIAERIGALCGLLFGLLWESRREPFSVAGSRGQKAVRFVVGVVGILLVWRGLAVVLPKDESTIALVGRFVRYGLVALWIIAGAPALFVRLNLLQRTSEKPSVAH